MDHAGWHAGTWLDVTLQLRESDKLITSQVLYIMIRTKFSLNSSTAECFGKFSTVNEKPLQVTAPDTRIRTCGFNNTW